MFGPAPFGCFSNPTNPFGNNNPIFTFNADVQPEFVFNHSTQRPRFIFNAPYQSPTFTFNNQANNPSFSFNSPSIFGAGFGFGYQPSPVSLYPTGVFNPPATGSLFTNPVVAPIQPQQPQTSTAAPVTVTSTSPTVVLQNNVTPSSSQKSL
jgi:hypothetical protein